MIDISDGLASEILHLSTESDKGITIYEEKLPITHEVRKVANELNLSATTCALNGGEDYELLFTISQTNYEKIKDIALISIIGHVTNKTAGNNLITTMGEQVPLQAQGWDSFNPN